MRPQSDADCLKLQRDSELLVAYASRRHDSNARFGIDRPAGDGSFFPTIDQIADLIATHSIHIAPYDAIVYARIDKREVGVKYSAVGGDKAKAVRLAVRAVLRLVGVVS